jgi:hypothetical protein
MAANGWYGKRPIILTSLSHPTPCTYCHAEANPHPAIIRLTRGNAHVALCATHAFNTFTSLIRKLDAQAGPKISESRPPEPHLSRGQQVAGPAARTNLESPMPNICDFITFWIERDSLSDDPILHHCDRGKIGGLEPCGLGERSRALVHWKQHHPRLKSLTGVIRVTSHTYLEFREDGTAQAYRLG